MSLRGFHVVFITCSTLLSLLVAAWCLRGYQEAGGLGSLAGALASALAGAGLLGYGSWFLKKTRRPA